MMELTVRPVDGGAIVEIQGRLDMVVAGQLRAAIDDVVGGDGFGGIVVLDLATTEFIDSSGLGAIVAGLKSARQRGGDLRIANIGGQVELVLGLTNLDRVLRPYPSVAEALDATA
jgi:anti-sigma B factor antagonist